MAYLGRGPVLARHRGRADVCTSPARCRPTPPATVVGADVAAQTDQVLRNLLRVTELCGGELADVVRCAPTSSTGTTTAAFNAAYAAWFPDRLPSRTCVGVTGLGRRRPRRDRLGVLAKRRLGEHNRVVRPAGPQTAAGQSIEEDTMSILYSLTLAAVAGLGAIWTAAAEHPGDQAVRTGRGLPVRAGASRRPRAGTDHADPARRSPAEGEHADHHAAGARPGRHHPRQRDRPRRCRHLLQGRGPGAGGGRRAGLHVGDRAGGADVAALDHRQEQPRRPAVQPGAAQPGPGADDRQPRAGLGHPHRPGRDQGRRACPNR